MNNNKFYTVKQVAELLGFSTNTVYKYLDEGKIKATRLEKEGRFRIPEKEVVRLLGSKHNPEYSENSASQNVSRSDNQTIGNSDLSGIPSSSEFSGNLIKLRNIGVPSLFDWFVGTLSIFLGLSHLLFSNYTLSIELEPYRIYIAFIKFGLVGFGIFLLAADIFKPRGLLWHRLTHILLAALFLVLAIIFYQAGMYSKVVGDGAIALILILAAFTKLGDKARFVIFINLLAIFAGFAFILSPQSIGFPLLVQWISGNQFVFGLGWFSLTLLVVLGSILGFYKNEKFLIFGAFLVGAGSLAYAVLAFGLGFWEDIIYSIVLASFIILLPFWHRFENFSTISKKQIIQGFGWLAMVLTIGFALVFYLQSSFKQYVASESKRSLETAIARIESYIGQAKLEVDSFQRDTELISLLESENKDTEKLGEAARRLLLGSGALRRVLIYDKDGRGIAVYPGDPVFQGTDFSDRDYFQRAKNTKKTVLAETIIPRISGPIIIVPIATPILDEKNEVLGIVAGSVDLMKLSLRLSEVKFGKGGYFIVACSNKRIVIHPENSDLYSEVSEGGVLAKALSGESGQIEAYDRNGKLSLQTYAPVNPLGWGLVAEQPITEVFQQQSTVSFVIFLMTIVMGVGSLLAIIYLRR